jgi:hypothetical protein
MKTLKTTLSILAIVILAACSKEDDSPLDAKTQLLTRSAWIPISQTISPELIMFGDTIRDFLQDDCSKDDFMVFNATGSGYLDEGPTICNSFDPQKQPFQWNFAANQSLLVMDKTDIYEIQQLDEETLSYSSQYDGAIIGGEAGVIYTITETFKH